MQQTRYEVINTPTPLAPLSQIEPSPGSYAESFILASQAVDAERAANQARQAALLRSIQEMSPTVLSLAKNLEREHTSTKAARKEQRSSAAHGLVAQGGTRENRKTGSHRESMLRRVRKVLGAAGSKRRQANATTPAGEALAAPRRRARLRTLFQSMSLS
ncbi:hypothetical protein VTO73DRAFT_4582 [Trametes versicolor]